MFGLEKAQAEIDNANKGKAKEVNPNQGNMQSVKNYATAFPEQLESLEGLGRIAANNGSAELLNQYLEKSVEMGKPLQGQSLQNIANELLKR